MTTKMTLPAGPDTSNQPLNIPGAPDRPDAGRQDDVTTRIAFDRATKDYACYATMDGREELIGYAPNHSEAAGICREYRFNYYLDRYTPERAAEIAMEQEPAAIYARPAGIAELIEVGDTQRGLYRKYHVERLNDPDGKHRDCPFFVLDLRHDVYARAALGVYIDACQFEYPQLAEDLADLLRSDAIYARPADLVEFVPGAIGDAPADDPPPARQHATDTECACCDSVQPCYDDGEAYICIDRAACQTRQVAAPATPASPDPATAPVATRFIRTERHDLRQPADRFDRDAWTCDTAGHVFWVEQGHTPLSCPRCDTLAAISPVACPACGGAHLLAHCEEFAAEWHRQEQEDLRAGAKVGARIQHDFSSFLKEYADLTEEQRAGVVRTYCAWQRHITRPEGTPANVARRWALLCDGPA